MGYFLAPLLGGMTCFALLSLFLRSPLVGIFGDAPNHRKVHVVTIPRFGGLALILSFLPVAMGLYSGWIFSDSAGSTPVLPGLIVSAVFLAIAGSWDDIRQIGFKAKFLLQFALAGLLVFGLGYHFDTLSLFGLQFEMGGYGKLFSMVFLVAVMNAVNIIDGIDGLAAGVSACAFAAVALIAHANGLTGLALVCLTFIGALGAFAYFNFDTRSKVFLGDTGSQFLGASLGLLAMRVHDIPTIGKSLLVPLFIVSYPLLDVSLAMTRRFFHCGRASLGRRVLRMFSADNDHLHHRLVYLGLSHLQSTFLLVLVSASLAATAFLLAATDWRWTLAVLGYWSIASVLLLNRLGYIGRKHWVFVPRFEKPLPDRIVGVIEPEDVFFHSLNTYKQEAFDFLSMPGNLTKFMGTDLAALILYNSDPAKFDSQWTALLRAEEVHECPAVVIAGEAEIRKVRDLNPDGFRSIRFLEKPVRMHELMRVLDELVKPESPRQTGTAERMPGFSLARLAMRRHVLD